MDNGSNKKQKSVIVILSVGRSGSSMVTEILSALGMRLSEDLIAANESNPRGFFESNAIVRIQDQLMRNLDADLFVQLPSQWQASEYYPQVYEQLKQIVREEVEKDTQIWGFKDPRTALFLPLWNDLFAELNIKPRYIVCVRHPVAVVKSICHRSHIQENQSELVWLHRTIAILAHTQADCFIAHFEDWFVQGEQMMTALRRYCNFAESDLRKEGHPMIDRSLVNYTADAQEVKNRLVRQLYAALRKCSGSDFSQEDLLATVTECQQWLDEFGGWNSYLLKIKSTHKGVVERLGRQVQQNEVLKNKIGQQRENIKNLNQSLQTCKKRYPTLFLSSPEKDKAQYLIHEIAKIRTSLAYKVIYSLQHALRPLGVATFILPLTLIDVLLNRQSAVQRQQGMSKEVAFLENKTIQELQNELDQLANNRWLRIFSTILSR